MEHTIIRMGQKKRIALVAHDAMKPGLLDWAKWNRELLVEHDLFATGTTGKLLEEVLQTPVTKLQSGPLGGDQQIGAKIAEGNIDFMIFFWDPLTQMPHDPDVKALLRIALVWNIPVACDRASADFMVSSTLMKGEYERIVVDYTSHRERQVEGMVQAAEKPSEAAPEAVPTSEPAPEPDAAPEFTLPTEDALQVMVQAVG